MIRNRNYASSASVLLAALAVGVLASSSATAAPRRVPQQQQGTLPYCPEGMSCVPMTTESFNRCYALAKQRGYTDRRVDDYYREGFIHKCLSGRVPG
jgi:hypothetical protein